MMEHAVRGTGRTARMVLDLPETGAIVVVPAGLEAYVRDMIRDLRGRDVLKVTRVVNVESAENAMRGRSRPVVFDHAAMLHVLANDPALLTLASLCNDAAEFAKRQPS